MKVSIERMNHNNKRDIYEFEDANKAFFEKTLPPRPDAYNQFESFSKVIDGFIDEQANGICSMYVIRDVNGQMVGRINLHIEETSDFKKAELGYRIAEQAQGNGYASEAVKLTLLEAFESLGIDIVEAGTSTKNIGSQKVLEKNGFKLIEKVSKVMKVNDEWIDGYLYSVDKSSRD